MKVVFTPSLDEHVAFLVAHQKRYSRRLSWMLSNAFFVLNIVFIPAALFFNNFAVLGIIVSALNLAFYFLLSIQRRSSIRNYYEAVWPALEEQPCEIYLDDDGVSYTHDGNRGFIPWPNIRDIFQNKQSVIIDAGHTQVLASKRGFTTEEDAKAFVAEAKELSSKSQR
jgi:hypothetical protein